jgi:general secretion pathway protein D
MAQLGSIPRSGAREGLLSRDQRERSRRPFFRAAGTWALAAALLFAQNPPVPAPSVAAAPGAQTPAQTTPAQPVPAQPAPPPVAPAPAKPAALPTTGALNLNNASLIEVIDILARDLKINYILDPRVGGKGVTINTYGELKTTDIRQILETILRMNGAAMVQVGDLYRIVPIAAAPQVPVEPRLNGKDLPNDEQTVLNLVFLKYATAPELSKLLEPFLGESGKLMSYDPANLLLILDNGRNMRRTMELIAMFDSETLAGQRVRQFEVTNGKPSDIAKELENIFKAFALSEKSSSIKFMPIDRINMIIAVAPNPGIFTRVEEWLKKLDVPVKVTAGSIDNYVLRIKYQRADIVAMAIMQLYGAPMGMGMGGGYGAGYGGFGGGASPFGMMGGGMGGYGMGGAGGMGGYGGGGYGMGGGGYGMGGGAYAGSYGTGIPGYSQAPVAAGALPGQGVTPGTISTPLGGAGDQTGNYLGGMGMGGFNYPVHPRVIPNPLDNTLLIQATPQEWEQIKNLVLQIDVPPRQVLIEAKVYEIDLTGALSAGVEAYIQKRGPSSDRAWSGNSNLNFSPGLNLSAGLLVGQARELLSFLQATETTTKAKVISAPSIIATDSMEASINVGQSVPTLSSVAASGVQVGGTTAFANNISNVDTGVKLTITPRINPSGVVTMKIDQDVSAPTAPPTGVNVPGNTPSFSQRNVKTQVTVQDGDTISIGGIIQDSDSTTSSGIPFLHRLPVVGFVFGNKSRSTSRTELIVFLTPHVIYDTNQLAEATEELKTGMKRVGRMMKDE